MDEQLEKIDKEFDELNEDWKEREKEFEELISSFTITLPKEERDNRILKWKKGLNFGCYNKDNVN